MALPKVGVQAVLVLRDFERAKRQYERALDDMIKKTEQFSRRTASAVKGITDSFDDFTKKSQGMQATMDRTSFTAQESIQIFQDLRQAFGELGDGAQIDIDKFDQLIERGVSYNDAFSAATVGAGETTAALGSLSVAVTAVSTALGISLKIVKDSIESYQELGDRVRRMSLELGVSMIQASGWVDAAERAGVSSALFNRAMVQLSRNIVNYRVDQLKGEEGNNNFAKSLRALGISVTDMSGNLKTAEQLFTEIQKRAQELGPGVITLGELSNALGFSTYQLTELLFNENLALEQVTGTALFYGKALGELDTKYTRELNKATNDLTSAWQGFKNFIARAVGPVVVEFKEQLASLINTARLLISVVVAANRVVGALKDGTIKLAESQDYFQEQLNQLLFGTTQALESEAALKRERDALAQQSVLVAAAEEDITDALDEQQKVLDKLVDAWNDYQNRIEDINRRFDDQLEDLEIKQGRERLERNLKLSFSLEDIYIKRGRKLRDLELKQAQKADDLRRDIEQKILDFERDAARQREKIAVKHRENLIKIETRFYDTVDEAARDNDTVAVVRAIRQRNRSLRDETRRFSVEQDELEKDLAIKRDKINEDAEERKRDLQRSLDDQRAIIEQSFRDEIDDLIRKNNREIILSRQKDEQRRQDIERNRAQALRDARIHYDREYLELVTHLNRVEVAVRQWAERMTSVARSLFPTGGRTVVPGITTGTPSVETGGTGIFFDWLNPKKKGMAHGGVEVVNRPTDYRAGEAGGEIAAFIPLNQTRNINHNFSNLPVDFTGLPGGMDTSQVEAIVYNVMVEVARSLAEAR